MLTLRPKSRWKPKQKSFAVGRKRYGGSRFGTLLVLTAMTAGGVYAYRHYFHHAGEAAVQLIPADALVVATLDGTPAPSQALVFKRIADACKTEHLDTALTDTLSRSQANSPLARDLRPYTTFNVAYARLKSSGSAVGTGDDTLFVAITDANRVHEVLAQDAQKNTANGQDYYKVAGDPHCMTVIGNYLVTADKPDDLARVEAVRQGETPAIATLPDYQQARAALPADSNVMLFASANAISQANQTANESGMLGSVRNPLRATRYFALGMAIHDTGIDSVVLTPCEPPAGSEGNEISHIAPLDANLLRKMPSGAYGVIALSQPGKYYHYASATAGQDTTFRRTMEESIASFERQTGLSVTRDILPGTNGNVALAVYPDADNPQQSVDGLVVMDDANQADPAALADRIRSYVERESTQNGGHPVRFTSVNRNGVLIWTLNPEAQQDLQRSLGSGVTQARDTAGMPPPSAPAASEASGPATPPESTPAPTPEPPAAPAPNSNATPDGSDGQDNNNHSDHSQNNGNTNANGGNRNESGSPSTHTGNGENRNNAGVDIHIHGGGDGRVFDDSFDLHHDDDRVHADHNGVAIHSQDGNSLEVSRNGVNIHSHDGDSMVVNRNGVDIHAHDNGLTHLAPPQIAPPTPPRPDPDMQRAVGNKTVLYAQIGHAVLIASSAHMLDRAIAAYQNGSGTLADDPAWTPMRQRITTGAQNALLLDLPGILNAVRPVLTQALANNTSGIALDDILRLCGNPGNGLVATQQYDGTTLKMTCFLPIDYEKAIHLAGQLQNRRGR